MTRIDSLLWEVGPDFERVWETEKKTIRSGQEGIVGRRRKKDGSAQIASVGDTLPLSFLKPTGNTNRGLGSQGPGIL